MCANLMCPPPPPESAPSPPRRAGCGRCGSVKVRGAGLGWAAGGRERARASQTTAQARGPGARVLRWAYRQHTRGSGSHNAHTTHTHTLGQRSNCTSLDSASACATAPLSASPTTSTVRTPKRPIRDNAMQWHIATPCMRDATTLSGQRPFSTQNVHSLCRGIHFTVWGQRDSTLMDSVVPLECGHGPNSSHRRSQAKWRSLFLSSHSRMAGQD